MLIPFILFGQNEPNTKIDLSKNNVYAETKFGLFSQLLLNYERKIYFGKKVIWYGRLAGGYGYAFGIVGQDQHGWVGSGSLTMLTGKNNKHFELNSGAFLGFRKLTDADLYDESPNAIPNQVVTEPTYKKYILPILNVGYRYQKPEGGFIFRANAGLISLGLSFGYAF